MTRTADSPRRRAGLGRPAALALLGLLAALAPAALAAQTPPPATQPRISPPPYEPLRRAPLGTRLINVATPYPVDRRQVEVLFTHRFQQTVEDGDSSNLWGLDGGADTGIGLAVGLTRHLDLALLRSSFQEDFELAGKFLFLEQAPRVPLTLALRAGVDRVEREGVPDPTRPFAQLLLGRRLGAGVHLLAAPSWVRDTPLLRDAWNVPLGLAIELPRGSLLELEVVPENRDLDASETAWHLALSTAVGGHIFEVVAGNSRAVTVDQMLGGDFPGGFDQGDVRLGFNIVRDFGF